MPLNNSNKLFVKNHESGKMEWRTETEDLRATTLAFILGVRGKNMTGRFIVDTDTYPQAPGYAPHNVAYQPSIMPGMPGTERFQQLCSLEYLQMYFEQVLSNKTIKLYEPLLGDDGVLSNLDRTEATTGPIGAFLYSEAYATKVGVVAGTGRANQGNPGLTLASNTMLNVEDIAKKSGLAGSQAALAAENYQGIFARDFGPFLKGKGSATQLVSCTVGNISRSLAGTARPMERTGAALLHLAQRGRRPGLCDPRRQAHGGGLHRLAAGRHRALQGRQRSLGQAV